MSEATDQFAEIARAGAGRIVLGIVVATVGMAAAGLYLFRRRGRDRALLWFGIFSVFYGIRLLIQTSLVRLAAGMSDSFEAYLEAGLMYLILPLGGLLSYELFPVWKRWFRWVVLAQIAEALLGLFSDQLFAEPFSMRLANNLLVIAFFLLADFLLFRPEARLKDINILRTGFLFLSATVFAANIGGLLHRPLDVEPVGFAVYLACLAAVVVRRTTQTQERLTAIEEELTIARRIQTSILPRELPRSASFCIAVRYLPMTAVAGDLYDVLIIDQNRLGILVADVTGHGVPAALIASMVKVAGASQVSQADDPASFLRGMNRTLCPNTQGQFVTAAYLFLDLQAKILRYAAAAHPRMQWLHRQTGEVEAIEENGLLMGLMAAAPYTFTERSFCSGDRFLLFTDGLLEAANQQEEFFGEERIQRALLDSAHLDPEQCVDFVLQQLSAWAGYKSGRVQDDDLTIVVLDVAQPA